MAFICNQARKARIAIIHLVRVLGHWIRKICICSPRKKAVEQDEGTGSLLSLSVVVFAERNIAVKLPKLQSL